MPYTRNSRRRSAIRRRRLRRGKSSYRRNRRRNRRRQASGILLRGPHIFPDQLTTKLTYVANVTDATATATGTVYEWAANAMYDPDAIGGQPVGFDQLMQAYSRYRVNACAIRIKYWHNSVNAVKVVIVPTLSTIAAGNVGVVNVLPYSKDWLTTAGDRPLTCKGFMSTRKLFGGEDNPKGSVNFQGNISANPSVLWYWNFIAKEMVSAHTPYKYSMSVELDFYATFLRRNKLYDS